MPIYFDLAIFHRTLLYLINEEIEKQLQTFSHFYKLAIVDDCQSKINQTNAIWRAKDYISLFCKHVFFVQDMLPSDHEMSDQFFEDVAKKLVFRSNNIW